MTAHVVELRSLIEQIRTQKNASMSEAAQLRQREQNVTAGFVSTPFFYYCIPEFCFKSLIIYIHAIFHVYVYFT